ncbi:MAG: DUF4129 domain-containing protein [Ferruginibacter sp.]
MKFFKAIILTAVLWFCNLSSGAQDNKEYIYQDTSFINEQADTNSATEAEDNEDYDEDTYTIDTSLYNNGHTFSPDSIRRLKNDEAFLYAKNLDSVLRSMNARQKKAEEQRNPEESWLVKFLSSKITRYFFWVLAACFILFVLYRLFFADGFFRRSAMRTDRVSLKEEETLQEVDLNKQIAAAVAEKNYRAATRYLYLQVLQQLADMEIISYAADKTNRQYFYELGGKPYQQAFAEISSHYEYVWYGGFEIGGDMYEKINNSFKQFNRQVKN